jgi:hypothetical protein
VTEIFDCSRVPQGQRADIGYGDIWVESMRRTLERLDRLHQPGRAGRRAVLGRVPAGPFRRTSRTHDRETIIAGFR